MNKFWLMILLSGFAGFGVAWSVNYVTYDRYGGNFGLMTYRGEIDASNVMQELEKSYSTDGFPKAEVVGKRRFDFGVMAPNEEGEHTFVVKNTGEKPLTLELGATTCKCTLGDLKSSKLSPGEQTEVKLSWTVKTNEDYFEQSAELRTNDPTTPAIRLVVAGNVVKDLVMEPQDWSFGSVMAGEEFVTEGKIFSFMDQKIEPIDDGLSFGSQTLDELTEFTIEEIDPSKEFGENAGAKQAFKVTGVTKAGMRQGAVSTQVLLRFQLRDPNGNLVTKDGEVETFVTRIDTTGRVIGSLSILPSKRVTDVNGVFLYNFGRIDEGDSLTGNMLLAHKGEHFKDTKLSIGEISPSVGLNVSMKEKLTGSTQKIYEIEISIEPQDTEMSYMGLSGQDYAHFYVVSDNPKVAPMRVAVKFAVDAKSKNE